jgi:death-on-curing family protein
MLGNIWPEPLPDFNSRYKDRLESVLSQPFQKVFGKNLHGNILDRATILFYLTIKSHPFKNGNKRMALILLLYYLIANDFWLDVSNTEIYNLAIKVAESTSKDKMILEIKEFINSNTIPQS